METKVYKALAMCLEKIREYLLPVPFYDVIKTKTTFEEFYAYLHTNLMRIVETFLIGTKLCVITQNVIRKRL